MEHTFFCRRSFISLLFQFLNQISRRYAIVFFGGLLYFSSPVNHSYLIQNTRTTNLITWIHRFTNHREDNGFPELAQRVMSRNCVSSTFIHPYLQIPHATRLRAHCSDPPSSAQYHPSKDSDPQSTPSTIQWTHYFDIYRSILGITLIHTLDDSVFTVIKQLTT